MGKRPKWASVKLPHWLPTVKIEVVGHAWLGICAWPLLVHLLHPPTPLWPTLSKLWTNADKLQSSADKLQTPWQAPASSESSHMPLQTLVPSPIMHPLANSNQSQVLSHAPVTCPCHTPGSPRYFWIMELIKSWPWIPDTTPNELQLNLTELQSNFGPNFGIGPYPATTCFQI